LGLPAFVLVKVLAPGFFARGDTATPVKIGMAAVALNLVLNVVLMGPLRHIGPAMATSIAAIFNAIALASVLRRRGHFRADAQLNRRVGRMTIAALAMGVALYFAQSWLFAGALHDAARLLALAALVAIGFLTYAVATQLTGAYDLREIPRMVSRRRLRGGVGSAINPAPTPEIPP
jgi:putative peptidoglycan lipid II flippase